MHKLLFVFAAAWIGLSFCSGCKPFSYYRGLDKTVKHEPVEYAGFVETQRNIPNATLVAKLRVRDAVGATMDCTYADMLQVALAKTRAIGGNLLVVTKTEQYQVKSRCFKIIGDIYTVPSLEGLEPKIFWHPKRPLLSGDLRRKRPDGAAGLSPVSCDFTCKTKGDYFNSVILRSETFFLADSTYAPADTAFRSLALRRAQLHFDLAEVHARRVKSALMAFGRNLPSITGQCRPLTEKTRAEYRQQVKALDAELQSGDPATVLARWETQVHGELAATEHLREDVVIKLGKN